MKKLFCVAMLAAAAGTVNAQTKIKYALGDVLDEYVRDVLWAQNFARLNRDEMMDRVMNGISRPLFGWLSDHIGRVAP